MAGLCLVTQFSSNHHVVHCLSTEISCLSITGMMGWELQNVHTSNWRGPAGCLSPTNQDPAGLFGYQKRISAICSGSSLMPEKEVAVASVPVPLQTSHQDLPD